MAITYLAIFFHFGRWQTSLYFGDSSQYYMHLVSAFVNQDVGDYGTTIEGLLAVSPTSLDPRTDEFGIRETEIGRRYIKYTLGVPLLELPFFLVAHEYASLSKVYAADGWSRPYVLSVSQAPIFFICWGLWLLSGVLLRYFSRRVTLLTILAVALATNLLYQSVYYVMAHGFLFFAHCLLIHLTLRYHDAPSLRKALGLGLSAGLIALLRVPEAICVLIPILWGVTSISKLKERVRELVSKPGHIALAAIGFMVVFSIQLAYWHYVSGSFFYDPYEGEGFDFLNPKIHKGWFAYRNGWLVYTPIMLFALAGLVMMRGKARDALLPILAFVVPHAYLHYSYYAWTYFPGFGQRPMVETYALLAFGLASFFSLVQTNKRLRWLPAAMVVLFGALNVFQTWQSNEGIIWSERANRPFFWATLGKTKSTLASFRAYDTNARQPRNDMTPDRTLLFEDFERYEGAERSTARAFEGAASLLSTTYNSDWQRQIDLSELEGNSWLRISVMAYFEPDQIPAHRDHCTQFVTEFYDDSGKRRRYRSMAVTSHIGNETGSIWTTGQPGIWDEAMFYFQLPENPEGWMMKTFVRNTHEQAVYLDHVRIDLMRDAL